MVLKIPSSPPMSAATATPAFRVTPTAPTRPSSRRSTETFFRQYLNDYGTDLDQQERLSSGLEFAGNIEE